MRTEFVDILIDHTTDHSELDRGVGKCLSTTDLMGTEMASQNKSVDNLRINYDDNSLAGMLQDKMFGAVVEKIEKNSGILGFLKTLFYGTIGTWIDEYLYMLYITNREAIEASFELAQRLGLVGKLVYDVSQWFDWEGRTYKFSGTGAAMNQAELSWSSSQASVDSMVQEGTAALEDANALYETTGAQIATLDGERLVITQSTDAMYARAANERLNWFNNPDLGKYIERVSAIDTAQRSLNSDMREDYITDIHIKWIDGMPAFQVV